MEGNRFPWNIFVNTSKHFSYWRIWPRFLQKWYLARMVSNQKRINLQRSILNTLKRGQLWLVLPRESYEMSLYTEPDTLVIWFTQAFHTTLIADMSDLTSFNHILASMMFDLLVPALARSLLTMSAASVLWCHSFPVYSALRLLWTRTLSPYCQSFIECILPIIPCHSIATVKTVFTVKKTTSKSLHWRIL